jgi:hypothetical protein
MINELPSFENPFFIIKLGPPGSGKSSEKTLETIRELGVEPNESVSSDVDKVLASFTNFRNLTRKVRNNYTNKTFNYTFYKRLSNIHLQTSGAKNSIEGKPIIRHMNGIVSQAIKLKKNVIFESTKPVNGILKDFYPMLIANNYRIIVIYHIVSPDTLIERIHMRGEELYSRSVNPYYRVYNPENIPDVITKLQENMNTFILPEIESGRIERLIVIRNE